MGRSCGVKMAAFFPSLPGVTPLPWGGGGRLTAGPVGITCPLSVPSMISVVLRVSCHPRRPTALKQPHEVGGRRKGSGSQPAEGSGVRGLSAQELTTATRLGTEEKLQLGGETRKSTEHNHHPFHPVLPPDPPGEPGWRNSRAACRTSPRPQSWALTPASAPTEEESRGREQACVGVMALGPLLSSERFWLWPGAL